MSLAIIFIFGLFVGSFLNVVIYRLHRGESFITGHSKCLFCQHRLAPKDLVPLFSYIFLRGRCRYCQHKISPQYFWVELVTALAFCLVFSRIFPGGDLVLLTAFQAWKVITWWIFVSFLIIIFVYDLRYYLILDEVVLPAIVIAFVANLLLGYSFLNLLFAAVVGGGFFLLQFMISNGRWIGGGDIRLGVLMGVMLGWINILTALFIAYIIGSVIALLLIADKRKGWSDKIPFGTFLSIATLVTLLYGPAIVEKYFDFFRTVLL